MAHDTYLKMPILSRVLRIDLPKSRFLSTLYSNPVTIHSINPNDKQGHSITMESLGSSMQLSLNSTIGCVRDNPPSLGLSIHATTRL